MATPPLQERIADAAVRLVDQNPALSHRARGAYKVAKRTYLQIAALEKYITSTRDTPQNVYHASIQRTGSRWIRSIFSDPRIKKYSGLRIYPQHEYEIKNYHDHFPVHTFVPSLYISYEQYLRIKKPNRYKTFYVIRDPRNVTLSWYKSMKETHKIVNESVKYYRRKFKKLGYKEGLVEAIKSYQVKISFMKDWFLMSKEDPNVFIVKFEDITRKPEKTFKNILKKCSIEVPKQVLKSVLKSKDKKKMRDKDERRRYNEKSDYRERKTDWKREFDRVHVEEFKKINGKVANIMGY